MNWSEIPKISLEAARVNAKLQQKEAAKLLGITPETLRNYETGKTLPDIGMATKIEALYKYPISHIFFEKTSL